MGISLIPTLVKEELMLSTDANEHHTENVELSRHLRFVTHLSEYVSIVLFNPLIIIIKQTVKLLTDLLSLFSKLLSFFFMS